ncbi:phosphotransferase [Gluconobacter frateurii]|uniref:phosphotransferase enzyme family protein n=1 Tax=Gluconobacter frateurii TaxID=38308 RepID=UPI001F05EFB5|nr:phosphotransferase [Gluconobacter frateurii]UMM09185.1 phosphotransferase [Gluconobacter frateurii]
MTAPGQFGVKGVQAERHWPPLTLNEASRVLEHFALAFTPDTLLWHGQRPFSATALVKLADGTVLFLKRHDPRLRDHRALMEEHAFMTHLAAQGLPVQVPLKDRTGRSVAEENGCIYEVFRPIPGLDLYRDIQSWEPFFCVEQARTAGRALAQLHLASQEYAAPARPNDRLLLSSFQAITQPDLANSLAQWGKSQPGLSVIFQSPSWEQDLKVLLPFHDRLKPLLPDIEPLWGHGDWHPSNQFWTSREPSAEICGIFDFGMSDRTCAAYDLAVAIERTAITWLAPDYTVAWDQLTALLAGYHSIHPLSSTERRLVVAFLPLVHVEFALSEVSYYRTLVHDEASATVAYSDYLLGHAHWFAGPEGQTLLNWLEDTLEQTASCP